MSFFSLIVVFLLEQLHPLDYSRWVARPVHSWTAFLERHIDAGGYRQGILGAGLALLLPLLLVGIVYCVFYRISPLLAFFINVLALYLTMGFRQFSHFYTDIQLALRLNDPERARSLLSEWRGEVVVSADPGDIARCAIETALSASHRHVFAVLLWFVILPGPLGALLYRLAHLLSEHWRERGEFGRFAGQLFRVVDWLPARTTAAAFAVVGNFEDAVYCWRRQSTRWYDNNLGIVLASGAGALGVRLGVPVPEASEWSEEEVLSDSGNSDPGIGEAADVDFMQSATGLVWRAIVLWLLMLVVLGLAKLAG
ncbi:cobalamin biosynthesis protein CobD [Betaproteobacteria bacterium]|nr:cobalamin biosynthesis protein CobD [Betaproteobacteria bacterium]GHU43778.1 cobalamin biosynthesis protein CobD [Betaproteobacteria bacterium]